MPIEQAEFGRAGHQSSRVIFGGAALAQVSQRAADETLDRMGVDHVDLWQLHALADPIEWDDEALSPGGALEAAVEAREQGLIRWLGVTGHGSQIAATRRRSLERFGFGSVLTGSR